MSIFGHIHGANCMPIFGHGANCMPIFGHGANCIPIFGPGATAAQDSEGLKAQKNT